MNGRVLRLLLDYLRRTLGVWPLVVLAHVMQITAFWAVRIERLPLLGVVIASLAGFAAFESPYTVLRTLPLSRADVALFRWWASIGAPGVIILLCTSTAWLASADNAWPHPSQAEVTFSALASWAVLAWLAVLPLPVKRAGQGAFARFALIWGVLLAAAFFGLPSGVLPRPVLAIFVALGLALSIASYVRAWKGQLTALSLPRLLLWKGRQRDERGSRAGILHGWAVLGADIARTTAVLSLVSLIAASIARALYPMLDGPVPLVWIFVSAVAVAACLMSRRWIHAVRSLRILPIGAHRLTLLLYGILMLPGAVACLVANVARDLSPHIGLHVPAYLFIVFLITPLTLVPWAKEQYSSMPVVNGVQQWAPLMQQAAWPLWAGALSAFGGPRLMPAWFLGLMIIIAVGFAIAGYATLFFGIRSPTAFERNSGPLGMAS